MMRLRVSVYGLGTALGCATISWALAGENGPQRSVPPMLTESAQAPAGTSELSAPLDSTDPVALLKDALQRCEDQVDAYTCVFAKQERLKDTLNAEQVMRVAYRESPRSVDMTWLRNAGRARRLIWIRGERLGKDGAEQALVEPAGALLRAFVGCVEIPIHGQQARKSSRRSLDEFGFRATLARLVNDNARLAAAGAVDWRCEGEGEIDGRSTLILVRRLPDEGPNDIYPDARLVVHLDREWRLPVAVYSYADSAGKVLLGSYITTNVQLAPAPEALAFRM